MDTSFFLEHIILVWVVIAAIFAVVEVFSRGLTTIWFAIGALAAAVIAVLKLPTIVQVAAFVAISIVMLYLTKPLLEKRVRKGKVMEKEELLVGQKALVVADITPQRSGIASVGHQQWTAIAEDPSVTIPKGREVTILRIEGVKLVVK
ncbi:MAG: NfeD family protein [Firmicutes bacterium]|nr:NfeD family protein [Clostridiales bacterium]MBQ9931290.1 NfeD family protein [Bacillota bacterium]